MSLEDLAQVASGAMTAATFAAKALASSVPQSSLDKWKQDGLTTYSHLLFRVASAPGQTDPVKLQKLLDDMDPKATEAVSSAAQRSIGCCLKLAPWSYPSSSLPWGRGPWTQCASCPCRKDPVG